MSITHPSRPTRAWRRSFPVALAVWLTAVLGACAMGAYEPQPAVEGPATPAEEVGSRSADASSATRDATDQGLSGPPTGLTPPAAGEEQLAGVVRERLRTGSYTYLRLSPDHGADRWVVTLGNTVPVGAQIEVENLGSRHDFHSRRLGRNFADLVFGVVRVVG